MDDNAAAGPPPDGTGAGPTYQVTIVKYGTRTGRRSEVFLNYPLYGEPDGEIQMDYFFWIVHGGGRTILVDTGFSPEGGASRRRTQLASFGDLCESFGVDAEATLPIALTHAHYDHAGNISQFPRAEVVMSDRELEFWRGRHAGRAQFHHSVDDQDLDQLQKVQDQGRLRLFAGRTEIAPSVEMIELGGHTPGQCVVKVPTSEGVVLLASDAVHYYEELEHDLLFTSVADLVGMYEGFDTINEMCQSGEVRHVVSGHDPSTLGRFASAAGPFGHLAATIGAPSA